MAKKIGKLTVRVKRVPLTDRLVRPTAQPSIHDVKGCAVAPRSSFEESRGWVTIDGYMVAAPFGADIESTDLIQLEADGIWWMVDGSPGEYETKAGRGKATVVYLKRVNSGQ